MKKYHLSDAENLLVTILAWSIFTGAIFYLLIETYNYSEILFYLVSFPWIVGIIHGFLTIGMIVAINEFIKDRKKTKKRTITLEDGTLVDCGIKEFDELNKAIKEGDHKKITMATVRLFQSSDNMIDKFVKDVTEGMKKFEGKNKENP